MGKVFIADPIDGCGEIQRFTEGETTLHDNIIAIVNRGNCRISIKARNAQWAGAKAVLVVDNLYESQSGWFGHEQGGKVCLIQLF